ncbi:MAG: DUF294 nucleotidyltransferase-like domain-containing protein [Candidatus Nanopelagicales bacterium]|nr:DUF294 nucleotidyltransferase-like domain-containing protein [Candidatus Nanopelagicales bacterium]
MTDATELVSVARTMRPEAIAQAADDRTRALVEGFVHEAGPPPARFAWVALGSHARGELHCASDQDHALVWETPEAARSSYAVDLAGQVIAGLERFGMRRCDGGYMADRWSHGVDEWTAILRERVQTPTPDAVVDADVFLDMRALTSGLDVGFAADELAAGSDSPRLLHGLAQAANAFPPQLHAFGRLPKGPIDLKRSGLAPIVLLARLYGLQARSAAVATDARLRDAASAGRLSDDLSGRLRQAYSALSSMRLRNQLQQIDNRQYVTDKVDPAALTDEQIEEVKAAFRAVKSAQAATSLAFRTDL